jgi:hypothetical protein
MSAPAESWCDPAGESPAQVKGSVLLGSECCVATGDGGFEAYTAIAWGVGLSHEMSYVAGAEGFHSSALPVELWALRQRLEPWTFEAIPPLSVDIRMFASRSMRRGAACSRLLPSP